MDEYVLKNEKYKVAKRGNAYYFIMGKELTGCSVRESLKTPNLEDALERAKNRYNQYFDEYAPELINSKDKSFQYLAELFLKDKTYPKHKDYMRRLYIPYFTKEIGTIYKIKDVSKLTTKDISNYLKYRRTLKTRNGAMVKNSTIKREWETLVQFFEWCYQNEYLKKPLILPKIKENEIVRDENGNDAFEYYDNSRDIFTDEEVSKIFNQYQKEINETINMHTKRRLILAYRYCQILYHTGLRTCDLRRVCWYQWEELPDGTSIFHNFYAKKKMDKRNIALCPKTTSILKEMKQEQETFCKEHNLVFDTKTTPLFCLCNKKDNNGGFNLKPVAEFDGGFRGLLQRCGINAKGEKVLYSWRHTFITKKVQADVPALKIAAHCGTSVNMIEKYYLKNDNLINKELLFLPSVA